MIIYFIIKRKFVMGCLMGYTHKKGEDYMDEKLVGLVRVLAQSQVSLIKQNQLLSNDECKSKVKKILYSSVGSMADDFLDDLGMSKE